MQDTAVDVLLVSRWYVSYSELFQMLKHHNWQDKQTTDAPAVDRASKYDVLPALSSTSF